MKKLLAPLLIIAQALWAPLALAADDAPVSMYAHATNFGAGATADDVPPSAYVHITNFTGAITPSTPILSGYTSGSVLFAGAGGVISQNNGAIFWDNSALRFGLGTNSSLNARLVVRNNNAVVNSASFQTNDFVSGVSGTELQLKFGAASGDTYASIFNLITGESAFGDMTLAYGGGRVLVGGTSFGSATFQVNGTFQVLAATPASNAACQAGQIAAGGGFIYSCVASGDWRRVIVIGGY